MQNGHANGKTNGKATPAKKPVEAPLKAGWVGQAAQPTAPAGPPPHPLAFIDDLPAKIRALIQGAVETAQEDTRRLGDRRYIDGLRRGATLISMSISTLDVVTKKKVAEALERLENELDAEEKKLREQRRP